MESLKEKLSYVHPHGAPSKGKILMVPKDLQPNRLNIPPRAFQDLGKIAGNAVAIELFAKDESILGKCNDFESLVQAIREVEGLTTQPDELAGALISWLRFKQFKNLSNEVFASSLKLEIENANPSVLDADLRNKILATLPKLLSVIRDDGPLWINDKITQLTYAHANIYTDSRILTDLRPIFNAEGTEVVRSIIVHELAIDFQADGESKKIHIALDLKDIRNLKKICERVELKVKKMSNQLESGLWKTIAVDEK